MKKLIATLILATLGFGFAAMAQTYNLKPGTVGKFSVLEPVQYNADTTVYAPSNLKLTYTVTDSINRKLKNADGTWYNGTGKTNFYLAQVYFTANDNFRMALFVDKDANQTVNELFINSTLDVKDYGIYLYENNDPTSTNLTYISLLNNDVEISEGQNFGVYYTADTTYGTRVNPDPKYGSTYEKRVAYNEKYDMSDEMGKTNTTGETYTTAKNYVASFDWEKPGNHSNMDATWYSEGNKLASDAAIFCMFQGPYFEGEAAYLEWEHVEFGFVTTGQPLPGTLATLLISGLCAGALRKRNKK